MALTEAQLENCKDVIVRALRVDIAVELAEYYGAAVFFGDNKRPEQPNNEIRNAINHYARAFEADTWEEAEKNIRAAESHIERAKRDSLKLAAIGLFQEIQNIILSIESHYGSLDPAFVLRKTKLKEKRREVYIGESSGNNNTTLRLLELFLEARGFLDDIQAKFPGIDSKSKTKLLMIKLRRHLLVIGISFFVGVASGVLGNYIWSKVG